MKVRILRVTCPVRIIDLKTMEEKEPEPMDNVLHVVLIMKIDICSVGEESFVMVEVEGGEFLMMLELKVGKIALPPGISTSSDVALLLFDVSH